MSLQVEIEQASTDSVPDMAKIRHWIEATWERVGCEQGPDVETVEVSVRIVDIEEMQQLNHAWRDQDTSTNVLSFPTDAQPHAPLLHIGDIVACAPVIADEARVQGKSLDAHWAHMCVHGTLHLLGHEIGRAHV